MNDFLNNEPGKSELNATCAAAAACNGLIMSVINSSILMLPATGPGPDLALCPPPE